MKKYLRHRIARLALALTSIAGASAIATVLTAPSAAASSFTITNPTLVVSNNAANLDSTQTSNTATYTWNFQIPTGSGGQPSTVAFGVPALASGTPSGINIYGFTGCGATTGSPSGGSILVTFTGGSSCSVSASSYVEVAIAGIVNDTTVGTYNSSIALTYASTNTDTATSFASPSFTNNQTKVDVVVPETLTLTNNATSISLFPTPSTAPTAAVQLLVSTNASGGYDLNACGANSGVLTDSVHSSNQIAAAPNPGTSASNNLVGVSEFGGKVGVTSPSGDGSHAATAGANWTTGYTGYSAACTDSASLIAQNLGPTSGDTVTVTNSAGVTALQPAGDYQGTINYLVTPSY